MRSFRAITFAAACLGAVTGAVAKTKGPTLSERRQAACFNDVQRLCPDTMPDIARTEACMSDKRPMVSAGCAKMWDVKD